MNVTILSIRDLKVHFKIKDNQSLFQKKVVKAVDGISFNVLTGETLGIVGESGCGKTTTGRAIVCLERPTEGQILFRNKNILSHSNEERFAYKHEVQMIFQDTYSTLDPRYTIGASIAEPLVIHKRGNSNERKKRVLQLMNDVGLAGAYYNQYPNELSGGQRQRIGVARALALNPTLIIRDEPISALDVSIQAQILNLLQDLQEKYELTYVFISHNLSVVKHLCNRIAVMYLGNIVELAGYKDIYSKPLHPYTQALINAIPIPDPRFRKKRELLEGDVPSPINPPTGCPFVTRCMYATEQCSEERPKLIEIMPDHQVACYLHSAR